MERRTETAASCTLDSTVLVESMIVLPGRQTPGNSEGKTAINFFKGTANGTRVE